MNSYMILIHMKDRLETIARKSPSVIAGRLKRIAERCEALAKRMTIDMAEASVRGWF